MTKGILLVPDIGTYLVCTLNPQGIIIPLKENRKGETEP